MLKLLLGRADENGIENTLSQYRKTKLPLTPATTLLRYGFGGGGPDKT